MTDTTEPSGWLEKDDRSIREIHRYMDDHDLDVFIPWKQAHLAYLLNYYDKLHSTEIPWYEMGALLAIPRHTDAFLCGAILHWVGLPQDHLGPWWLSEFYEDWGPMESVIDTMVAQLSRKGLATGRIGIELNWVPAAVFQYLRSKLPGAELVAADWIVPQIRFIKTPRERTIMAHAASSGLRCMERYMQALRNGSNREYAELLRARHALDYGCEFVGGARRINWTGGPDNTAAWWDPAIRQAYEADPVGKTWNDSAFDAPIYVSHIETRYHYYYADLAWHKFIGPPPTDDTILDWGIKTASHDGGTVSGRTEKPSFAELREDFRVIRRVQSEAIQCIRPGMDQFEAKRAVEAFLAADSEAARHITMYFLHSLGLEIHEEPILAGRKVPDTSLPVPADHPIYYRPGAVISSEWFTDFWTVEEPFELTEHGWRPLIELHDICDLQ